MSKKELKQIDIIEQENCIHAKYTGFVGGISKTFEAFQKLHESTTSEEMIAIFYASDSTMKIYAYWSLKEKAPLSDTLTNQLNPNDTLCYFSGCIMGYYSVIDICHSIDQLYRPKANGEQWFEIGKHIKPKKIRKRKKF